MHSSPLAQRNITKINSHNIILYLASVKSPLITYFSVHLLDPYITPLQVKWDHTFSLAQQVCVNKNLSSLKSRP